MPFCSQCGKRVSRNAQFCDKCGASFTKVAQVNKAESQRIVRQLEYAGNIRKCPACGEDIPSFTAICPSCGHEINSARVTSAIDDFINKLNEADARIENNPKEQNSGWKTWGIGKKILWVLFNIYTACIPLLVYLICRALGITTKKTSLTPTEKEKAQIINSYPFPNDRENILEGLFLIQQQVTFLTSEKIDKKNYKWIKIWKSKADQLYKKTEILFYGDTIADETYQSIVECKKQAKRTLLRKDFFKVLIAAVIIGYILTNTNIKNRFRESTFNWPTSGIATQLPTPNSSRGRISYNTNQSFVVEVKGVYQADYEDYIESCIEHGFNIEGKKENYSYEAYNSDGYLVEIYNYGTSMKIELTAPEHLEDEYTGFH